MESYIPIAIALIAALPGIYAAFYQKRKDETDREKIIQEAMLSIIQPLKDRVNELEREIDKLQAKLIDKDTRIMELENKVDELENENRSLRLRLEAIEQR